jgi:hypothetical protein
VKKTDERDSQALPAQSKPIDLGDLSLDGHSRNKEFIEWWERWTSKIHRRPAETRPSPPGEKVPGEVRPSEEDHNNVTQHSVRAPFRSRLG